MLYQTQNPHGGDIYGAPINLDFSANTNPLGTPARVVEAVQRSALQMHRYPDPYCRELVQAISAFEDVPKEYVLCGNGAAELIYAYCEAVSPRRAVELAPTFSEYGLGLRRISCRVERYTLQQACGFELTEDFLRYLTEEKPDAVFLCNPNNPTGKLIDKQLLQDILGLCEKQNTYLFVDECFLDLTDEGESLKDFLADYPMLLILKAFTKSYGMAGVRLGYCLSSNGALLGKMATAVQPWNVSSLAQAAGVAALGEQQFLQDTRALIRTERSWLKAQLEHCGFWVCPSQANFLLFRGPEELHTRLKDRKIAIRNCDNYYGLGAGWYRIAVKLHHENQMLMDAITRIVERK